MKDLGEAKYIIGIRIYRVRKKCLIGLIHSTYIDKILKRFSMKISKKGDLPIHHVFKLSKTQCPSTVEEIDDMS